MQKIKSLVEARKEFSTQIKCEEHLAGMRWPDGVVCARCGAKHPSYICNPAESGNASVAISSPSRLARSSI